MAERLIDWHGPVLSNVLDLLVRDMTTGRSIMFMTDAYMDFGMGFDALSSMDAGKIRQADIKTRAEKCLADKKSRTKSKAEVFTPAWLVNKMLNVLDEQWFGRSPVFNVELDHDWNGIGASVSFNGLDWKAFVKRTYLEITCGEAPFITRRYDAVTGVSDRVKRRIGALDRKLKVVSQQCRNESPDEMVKWGLEALKSCYGYEYQGDSLAIARANVLLTFVDFCRGKAGVESDEGLIREACDIICWNFWQMDGLENVVPGTGERCIIMDWDAGEPVFFDSCATGADEKPVVPESAARSEGGFFSDADADDGDDADESFEPIGQELFVASSVGLLVNSMGRSTLKNDEYARGEKLAYKLACQYYGTVQGFQAVLDRMGSDGPVGLPAAGFLGMADKIAIKGRVSGAMKSSLASFRDEAYDPMLRLCRDSAELLLRAVIYHQRECGEVARASRDMDVLAGKIDWSGLPDGLEPRVRAFVADLAKRDRGGRDFRFLLDAGAADTGPDDEGTDLRAVISDTGKLFAICRKHIFGGMNY